MNSIPKSECRLGGDLGGRLDRDVENWLLRVPGTNPGIIEMFRVRDRPQPYAPPVPWAGEFAGKYLISAVQACRMTDDPRLKPFVQSFVNQLVATQGPDGYLGPWAKDRRFSGNWDLWCHYHCMLGLLMWYDATGDQKAYDCVARAADWICSVYVDGDRRPIEATSPPMNFSIIHIMGELYLRTGNAKYMEMIRRIEEDMPKDGDWLVKGAEGVPYHKLPWRGPRWESLHLVQGFAKLYQITGDEKYKKALWSLWDSIRKYDRHPSGAFSSDESAVGSIFRKGVIETCCSVAWTALSIDALKLTEDATVADELELTLWNQGMAAQHPSGSWCTYDTPLNGVRDSSLHQIGAWQHRPGTSELNCCSVNNPRVLGMVSEWAVMRDAQGLVVNFYGPGTFDVSLGDGTPVTLIQKTAYPVEGLVRLEVQPKKKSEFALKLRIPAWSRQTSVTLDGKPVAESVKPGTFLTLNRKWKKGDVIELMFDMTPRYLAGQAPERTGAAAIHVGPLLLAFDTHYNAIEISALKPINVTDLHFEAIPVKDMTSAVSYPPMGLWKTMTDGGEPVVLCDFASAGLAGTRYAAWVPASHLPPAATSLILPAPDTKGKPGPVSFYWVPTHAPGDTYDLQVAKDAGFGQLVVYLKGLKESDITVTEGLEESGSYYWRVRTVNACGVSDNDGGARVLHVDPAASQAFYSIRADRLMVASSLDGNGAPSQGVCVLEQGVSPAADRKGHAGGAVRLVDASSRLYYSLPFFPQKDYSAMFWICPEQSPAPSTQYVFSAWANGADDPLRVTLTGNAMSARIKAGAGYWFPDFALEQGKWAHIAVVKNDTTLSLYVYGKLAESVDAPKAVVSQSIEVGVGCSPLYGGGEVFTGKIDDVAFYARALDALEIEKAYKGN